ncbi:hypothetical protein E2C01_069408 [Portunus trituberculatus]|uniref:Uncharacterized protein n=1 Tax=Portunus trituberculatus TaxID=210409 RepID=A0A5B7HYT0_PORTR|nr:hypothetical protein [Portunus trituberculatus]
MIARHEKTTVCPQVQGGWRAHSGGVRYSPGGRGAPSLSQVAVGAGRASFTTQSRVSEPPSATTTSSPSLRSRISTLRGATGKTKAINNVCCGGNGKIQGTAREGKVAPVKVNIMLMDAVPRWNFTLSSTQRPHGLKAQGTRKAHNKGGQG